MLEVTPGMGSFKSPPLRKGTKQAGIFQIHKKETLGVWQRLGKRMLPWPRLPVKVECYGRTRESQRMGKRYSSLAGAESKMTRIQLPRLLCPAKHLPSLLGRPLFSFPPSSCGRSVNVPNAWLVFVLPASLFFIMGGRPFLGTERR